jgi:hypothetical protein
LDRSGGADHRLARVRGLKRPFELAGDPEPGDGQGLFHALSQRGGSAGVFVLELDSEAVELI